MSEPEEVSKLYGKQSARLSVMEPAEPTEPSELAVWQVAIKRLVGKAHGSQKSVAEKCEMSETQFSGLINTAGYNPTLDTLQRVADALGVDIAELFSVEPSQEAHERPVAAAPDLEAIRLAIRGAIGDVLADIVLYCETKNAATREQVPSAGTPKPAHGAGRTGRR